jgi:hypothetical protein
MGWRFYVYELLSASGEVLYIGKGSGYRLGAQKSKYGLNGREFARFKRERDAYTFEAQRIASEKPALNKCAGGGGSLATPKRQPRKTKWEKELDAIGSRRWVARYLLRNISKFNAVLSKDGHSPLDAPQLAEVAYGPRC